MVTFVIVVVAVSIIISTGLVILRKRAGYTGFDAWFTPVASAVFMVAATVGGVWVVYDGTKFAPLGPKPSGGCGTIEKIWTETVGGGGNFLARDPIHTNRLAAIRFDNGSTRTFSLGADEYGAFVTGDKVDLEWSKVEIASLFNQGEIWQFTLSKGCDAHPQP